MCDQEKSADYFSKEAIAERRKDDPPEVAEAWKHARNAMGLRGNTPKHWDGKPKKEKPDF